MPARKPARKALHADDADAVVIHTPSPCRPQMGLPVGSLAEATAALIGRARKARDENREMAARRLMACLRVGDADAVADALVEQLVPLLAEEDDDE